MVSSGAIAAAAMAARLRKAEDDRRRRRKAEDERRKRRAEEERKRKKAEEDRRRRKEEEERHKRREEEKRRRRRDEEDRHGNRPTEKLNQEQEYRFSTELRIKRDDLVIVHSGAYESILQDGSRLSSMVGKYVRTYPNGRVQEYKESVYGSELTLTREELPNGAMVVYGSKGKEYERDKDGNYVCYKRDQYMGEIVEKIEGKVDLGEAKEFSTEYEITIKDLGIVFYGAYDDILLDGSRLSYNDGKYVRTHPNGRVQEYRCNGYGNDYLILTREELPNGAMVVYDYGKKEYERDKDGNYVYYKRDQYTGEIVEKIEGRFNGDEHIWTKSFYNKDGNVKFYQKSDEPNKKYYPSGRLYEEIKEDKSCFQYAENGICLYEKNANDEYCRYQLTPDGKDRLLIEKGKGSWCLEKYLYYPSGQLKEKSTYYGGCFQYTENGICLYEKHENGQYSKYQLTPDGEDRLLIEIGSNGLFTEKYSYYPSGRLKEAKHMDGSCVKYNEDQTYSKFDKDGRLTEMTDATGKTCFSHYPNSKQVKHIVKYDIQGQMIEGEYKHFTSEGVENTKYYLAIKQIIASKIEKSRRDAIRDGTSLEKRKISKKMSKAEKVYTKIKAKINSR